jgi:(hydroxyamino)benzene mutase
MTTNAARGGRGILVHGMVFILVGLLWGLVVPHTPYPRLALGAHIQFEQSGILFMILGILLLTLPHGVGKKSVCVMLLAVWLTWIMAFSEVANAWWGTIQMLPIAGHEAGATGGTAWQELVVKLTHILAGVGLIVAWMLLIVGFVRKPGDVAST